MDLRYFQWLKTERKGQLLVFDKIEDEDNEIYVVFKDGSRCNEKYILPLNKREVEANILMAEVEDTINIWKFEEKWVGREEEKWAINQEGENVCVQPFIEGKKTINYIPPRYSQSKFGNLKEQKKQQLQDIVPIEQQKTEQVEIDPVHITLDKSKKTDVSIDFNLTISLPSKDIFKIIMDNFEDGGNKAIQYIIKNIDIDIIKNSLRSGLDSWYSYNEPICV